MSRSVHVAPIFNEDGANSGDLRMALARFFSQWGYVEECVLKTTNNRVRYAFIHYASQASAQQAVALANEQLADHQYLARARVTHPYFSKFYTYERRARPGSYKSHPSTDNGSASGSLHSSPHHHRQGRQQFGAGTPPRDQRRANTAPYRSPANRSTSRATPPRYTNQHMADASGPAPLGDARAQNVMHYSQLHQPVHPHAGLLPSSPSRDPGHWTRPFSQGSPGLQPEYPPLPTVPHGPHTPGRFGPCPQNGWPSMPMLPPPGFMPYATQPPPPPGFESQHAGPPQGFPLPHSGQFVPRPPIDHSPQIQSLESSAAACAALPEPRDGKPSMQTKPPSDEEAFQDGQSPVKSLACSAHSSNGSMSIRVRLPGMQTDPQPDEPPVFLPNHNRVSMNSPVRRITFGDFVPVENPVAPIAPVAGRTEPDPLTPRPVTSAGDKGGLDRLPAGSSPENHPGCNELSPTQRPASKNQQTRHDPTLAGATEHCPSDNPFGWQLDNSRSTSRSPSGPPSRRDSGDVRLDPDYTATVIRRRLRGQHGRIPLWGEEHDSGFSTSRNLGRIPLPAYLAPMFWRSPYETPYQPYEGQPCNGPPCNGHSPRPPFNGMSHQPRNGASTPSYGPAYVISSGTYHQLPGDPRPSKQTKKKQKNKHKTRPGPDSQTHSRCTTPPQPATNGNALYYEPEQDIPDPANLISANGNNKGKGKAVARPITPIPPDNDHTTWVQDDIYNATPRKDKGEPPNPSDDPV